MTERKGTTEAGWNLDNSYAHLPKSFFTILNPTPCTFTEVDYSQLSVGNISGVQYSCTRK